MNAFTSAEVSVFESAFAPTPAITATLGKVADDIRSDANRAQIEELRELIAQGKLVDYTSRKRSLSAFLVSGVCTTRSASIAVKDKFAKHSGFLQIDLDRKDNPQLSDLPAVFEKLKADDHVACAFLSPSGQGYKVICAIAPDVQTHRACWQAAADYFKEHYDLNVDRSTKDPLRLCFTSYDPNIYVRETDAVPFAPAQIEAPKPYSSGLVPHEYTDTTADDIREMLSYIPRRPDYDEWLKIASAVWNTLPRNEADALLSQHMPEESAGEYAKKYARRLTQIGIGTLVYIAQQYGYDASAAARRRHWCGRAYFGSKRAGPNAQISDSLAEQRVADTIGKDVSTNALTSEFIKQCFILKQDGDAQLFAELERGKAVYDHKAQIWRRYRNGIWTRDESAQTILDVAKVAETYAQLMREVQQQIPAPEAKDGRDDMLKALSSRIDKLHSVKYSTEVLNRARSHLSVADATAFDTDPYLVVCRNKTVNLKDCESRPHSPTDLLTVAIDVNFDSDAKCPHWDAFLDLVFNGDQDLIRYIARAVGYTLSGLTSEDVMFFCVGSGKNGKSTFKAALEMLFGDYAGNIMISSLLTSTFDSNVNYQKATLKGRRLVFTDEIPEGRRFNEQQIKAIVGGDKILARSPYEKPFEFNPTHKLWPIGNHTPVITGTDNGIWRRIHLVPFGVTIPAEKQRPREQILAEFRKELSGILNWILSGWIDYQEHGLNPPQAVLNATTEYRDSQDQIANFVSETYEMTRSGNDKVQISVAYQAYNDWCKDCGEFPVAKTRKNFGKKLREHGYEVCVSTGNKTYIFGLKERETSGNTSQFPRISSERDDDSLRGF